MEVNTEGIIKLSEREKRVLEILRKSEYWTKYTVERKSDKEFDINIEGEQGVGENKWPFSAWMPLSIISGVNWADNKIWKLSDGYGNKGYIPIQGHDWSGIRDSSNDAIWEMMYVALRMMGEYIKR